VTAAVNRDRPDVAITGFGVLCHGYEGSRPLDALDRFEPTHEELLPGLTVPVGRVGRLRGHPLRKRFDKLSTIDAFGQYALIAAGHAIGDASLPAPDERTEGAGVIMGTCFGCQEANYQFDQFSLDPEDGFEEARPVVFKSTVDNVPAGWISMAFRLRGVNVTFTSGPGAGAEAVMTAVAAIAEGRARHVLTGGAERLIPLQLAALAEGGELPTPFAAEGAAVLVLEHPGAAAERGVVPRARIRGGLRLSTPDHEAIASWLDAGGNAVGDISIASVVAAMPGRRDEALSDLRRAGLEGTCIVESDTTGEMFSAQAPLALELLVERLARLPSQPALGLLHVSGEPGDALLFLVETCA
jgi:hypothetical protein